MTREHDPSHLAVQPRLGYFSTKRSIALGLVALAFVLPFWGRWIVAEFQGNERNLQFDQLADEHFEALQKEIENNIDVVETLAGFCSVQREMSRSDFATFVTPILERHPTIQALSFTIREARTLWPPRVSWSRISSPETSVSVVLVSEIVRTQQET